LFSGCLFKLAALIVVDGNNGIFNELSRTDIVALLSIDLRAVSWAVCFSVWDFIFHFGTVN